MAAYMNPTTLAEARREVDIQITSREAQITALRGEVIELKARRNAFSIPSGLPPEVLSTIFTHYKEGSDQVSPNGVWMQIAFVCRRWRSTALGHTFLWNVLDVAYPPGCIDAMLERSRSAPLTLKGQVTRFTIDAAIRLLQLHDRVHNINIFVSPSQISRISEEAAYPALCLASLAIFKLTADEEDVGRLPRAMDFFRGQTPCLRSVTLSGINIDLRSPIFSKLTTLRLAGDGRPECDHLFRALRSCPLLEVLALDGMAPPQCAGFQNVAIPSWLCTLQHLRVLELGDYVTACAHLLSHLQVPRCTSVLLDIILVDREPEQLRDLLRPIVTCMDGAAASRHIRAVAIDPHSEGDCGVVLQCARDWEAIERSAPQLQISLQTSDSSADPEQTSKLFSFLATFCQALPLSEARWLEVRHDAFRPGVWHAAFTHAKHLNKIRVYGKAVVSMAAAVRGRAWCMAQPKAAELSIGWAAADSDHPPLFAEVQTVQLLNFDMNDFDYGGKRFGVPDVINWYRALRNRENPLQRLRLAGKIALDRDEVQMLEREGISLTLAKAGGDFGVLKSEWVHSN